MAKHSVLLVFCVFLISNNIYSQPCVSQSAPTPQVGAHMEPQFSNLWKQANVQDKHGQWFRNGTASIGDDGWTVDGVNHQFRFYYGQVLPRLRNNDVVKVKFRGTIDQAGRGVEACQVRNIVNLGGGFISFDVVIANENNGNGFVFDLKGRCTDIQMMRPGYEFDDPRLLTDDYVRHSKPWTTYRYMNLLSAPSNFGQTWGKRVSPNAPAYINSYAWSLPNCNNPKPNYRRFSEDITPVIVGGGDGMWSPGAPWETLIDISNYLNIDMWINIPTMADDNYVLQLSKLIKQRLKPTLNVNVEIGNELWNTGPPFMGFYMVRQMLQDEWNQQNAEKLKILGGTYCPGCELSSADPGRNRTSCGYDDYQAMQRWMARRLKEMMDQFAVDWGWKAEGGVGSRIRATLAGQIGYATQGHGWNIREGIEFLAAAYGPESVSKYLYSTSVAAYFKPGEPGGGFTRNLSIDQMAQNYSTFPMQYIFGEFANETWGANNWRIGNKAEGIFGLARMYGLKMYAYEGGNELGNGGDGGANGWITYDNASAAMADGRFGNVNTDLLNTWFSWFGYDALFIKNGDYVGGNNAYGISQTLNEDNAMRQSYIRVANSPAPPLSKVRGGVIGLAPNTVLDARKHSAYYEYWNEGLYGIRHKNYQALVDNNYVRVRDANNEPPMIIRCEKTGTYKIELERALMGSKSLDDKYPTYCDIFLNEKLVKSGVRFNTQDFSRSFNSSNGNTYNYWWTEAVDLDIPYGVHALRIRPSLPTAERRGNLMAVFNENPDRRYQNELNLMAYRFNLASELPPVQPKEVIGDLEVCKGNNKARYEVGENDGSVCEYEWIGIPATAKIQPAELVAGSSPARYLSGPKTYKIYIDWATTPPGTYDLRVKGKNQKSDGTWQESILPRTFKVVIKNCGFEFSPNPVCLGQEVIFTPIEVLEATTYLWDNGKFGQPNELRFSSSTTSSVYKTTYDVAGTYDVNLQVSDNSGNKFFYSNRLVAVSCNTPIVQSPLIICKGAASQPLTATLTNDGTNLTWYTAATGDNGKTSTAPTPVTTNVDTITYWVTQQNATGESDRAKIDVIISDVPVAPVVSSPNPLVYCVNAPSILNDLTSKVAATNSATLKWYSSATSPTSVANPPAPVTSSVASSSWFISQAIGDCESPKVELKIVVNEGPNFDAVAADAATCGEKGSLTLRGLTPNTAYEVTHSNAEAQSLTSTQAGEIILELGQGSYSDLKVSQSGCTTSKTETYAIAEPTAPNYNVIARQPKECGASGSLVLKGLLPNRTYSVSYNDVRDKNIASTGDSIEIIVPAGDYNSINVSLAGCSKADAGNYKLTDPVVIPPVVLTGIPNYCQNQQVNIEDITSKVQKTEGYELRWYETLNGTPANFPQEINTVVAGTQSKWVSQANTSGCQSEKLEIRIQVSGSTALTVSKEDPTSCTNTNGRLVISNLISVTEYTVDYKKEGLTQDQISVFSDAGGTINLENLAAGNYSSIAVTRLQGSNCATTNMDEVFLLENPEAPKVAPTLAGGGEYCKGTPIALSSSTATMGGTIEWYTDVAKLNKVHEGSTYEPVVQNGTATFFVLENLNQCKGPSGQVTVSVVNLPIAQDISTREVEVTCNGTTFPISLRSEVGVVYKVYKDEEPTEFVENGTGQDIRFEVSEQGEYTVKAEAGTNKCPADMIGLLTISGTEGPRAFNVSGGGSGCEGSAQPAVITLDGSQTNVEYALLNSGLSQASQPIVGDGNSLSFTMDPIVANNDTYQIEATDLLTGCNTMMTGSAAILIQEGLMEPILSGEPNYCNKTEAKLAVTNLSAGATQAWSISPATIAGTIDNSTGNIIWASDFAGEATIQLVVSSTDCGAESKTASFVTSVNSAPSVGPITGDSLVCRGNIKTYNVAPLSDVTYDWSVNTNANFSDQDDSKGAITITYNIDIPADGIVVTVTPNSKTCGAGLPSTKVIKENSGCDLFVPNVLTPSSADNFNVWSIEGIENYPRLSVKIFNRWGGQVFSQNNGYTKKWDGTINGKPLPTATYFYVIDKNDGSEAVTGSVTVVRD